MPENFDTLSEFQDVFERAIKAFAQWAAENWTTTPKEAETLTEPSAAPAEYARGYNDAIAAIPDALAVWLEEFWL